jgi:hypothetical protein
MYIYDHKLEGRPDRRAQRSVTLRPSRTYSYRDVTRLLGDSRGIAGLADCDAGAADAMAHQTILDTIQCELLRPFSRPDDPRLLVRRQRLRELFKAVPISKAMDLYEQLQKKDDPLGNLLSGRLHPATTAEMLAILGRRFFKEYELRFNSTDETFSVDNNPDPTLDKALRKKDVNDLVGDLRSSPGILWRRLIARIDAAMDGKTPDSAQMPIATGSLVAAFNRISDAQLALFREWFPDGKGGINFKSFQLAFEAFSNGELRDPSVAGAPGFGEPNTGAFFLFAEFAFLCVDSKRDESDWGKALRTFVKVQEIFMHVYREKPKSPPPPVNAALPTGDERRDVLVANGTGFVFSNFRQGAWPTVGVGQSDEKRKRALRDKYDAMSVSQLPLAARDNLIRAMRMP